ncbi:hypothetical protein H0H81_010590 [Sphagnurus paluster]|uniref:Uncharacterized protein n=1 Tax=Sphagnurus paluster TaxID=117069 RepID=A0A9P7GPT6_9AGAR|nr:hypothetical protein H0H81_010590 [Sphagnurus paluster]
MAAERITQNPYLETVPDHAGPHYDAIQVLLVTMGIIDKQADQTRNTSWTCSHEEGIQAWDQQVTDDAAAQEEEHCLTQEQEDQQRTQRELELENEPWEIEKKKPKMNDFNENTMVNDFLRPRPSAYDFLGPCPSAYALCRLAEFDYTELWYFTQEGCANIMHLQIQNEDTFSLMKIDDVVSFRPVSALKALKNVIQDIDLTWPQMEIAKTTLIQNITKCGWAEKATTVLAQFFMNLEGHHYPRKP